MSEMSVAYTEDGEWISIATNVASYGSMVPMEPDKNTVVTASQTEAPVSTFSGLLNLSIGKFWARGIDTQGNFSVSAPYDDRLVDWQLQLSGFPRIYEKLKLRTIEALFGVEVVEQIHAYHGNYSPKRESVGDLLMKYARRGPLTHSEAMSDMKQSKAKIMSGVN